MEREPEDEADDAEDEPSLGSLDRQPIKRNGPRVHVTTQSVSTTDASRTIAE
jgi:hypothetical protein